MTGVSEPVAPTANVTRATVVTVLWRMEGSPAPTATVSFGDVSPEAWYAQPVAWAKGERNCQRRQPGDSNRINPSHARSWRPSSPALTNTGAYRWPRLPQPVLRRQHDRRLGGGEHAPRGGHGLAGGTAAGCCPAAWLPAPNWP